MIPILNQMHPGHTFPPYFPKVHLILSFHLHPGLTSGLFHLDFTTKLLYAFLISCATCPAHFNLDLMVNCTNYEAPHYVVFSRLLKFPLRAKYSFQHPVL